MVHFLVLFIVGILYGGFAIVWFMIAAPVMGVLALIKCSFLITTAILMRKSS
jgi:hypothetical protein